VQCRTYAAAACPLSNAVLLIRSVIFGLGLSHVSLCSWCWSLDLASFISVFDCAVTLSRVCRDLLFDVVKEAFNVLCVCDCV